MQLSKDFTLEELVLSQTAAREGIDNTPSDLVGQHLQELVTDLLQPIRDLLGVPIVVSSGYRSVALNASIGGVATSAHCYGYAADITAPAFGNPRALANWLIVNLPKHGIKWDQIIWEFGDWVHVAIKSAGGQQRGQVLTAKRVNGKAQYFNGIV